jgi:predicted trehalose synthase
MLRLHLLKHGVRFGVLADVSQSNFGAGKQLAQAAAEAEAKLKEAEAAIEIAKAEAEAKKIAADAEAEANRIVNDSLTDKILQEKYLEKWDGKLPNVMTGEGGIDILFPVEATE